jgi:hypothetical protein
LIGLSIAFCQALTMGIITILMRSLAVGNVNAFIPTLITCFIGIPISFIFSVVLILVEYSHFISNIKNNLNHLIFQIFLTILIGSMGVCNQVLLMLALKYEEALKISKQFLYFHSYLFKIYLNIMLNRYN